MHANENIRRSISATVDEIVERHRVLGLPIEAEDFEAWQIIDRIEKKIAKQLGQWPK